MPKAGFWAVGGYKISFRRDGLWYADDEVIENKRIALLFARHIRRGDQAAGQESWVVDLGIDCQPVVVEDTPLVVVQVEKGASSGDQLSLDIRCNDGVVERLDPNTLRIGNEDVLYCQVHRGERGLFDARLLRPAYYTLAEFFELNDEGSVVLRLGDQSYGLGRG